jgi:Ca2+/Na+ antiporter
MYRVRSFMILAVLAPLLFAYSARLGRKFGKRSFRRVVMRFAIIGVTVVSILFFFQTSIADEYIQEAAVINEDMTNNKTYGTNRYDLGITDYSPAGMALAFPNSVIAGFYRPFIWESLSISLLLNGIESIVLFYFTFRFLVSKNIFQRIKRIRNQEFLVFAFFFALILGYFAGFTSILFGVLVRFKAPLLPFLVITLTSYLQAEKYGEETKLIPEPVDGQT